MSNPEFESRSDTQPVVPQITKKQAERINAPIRAMILSTIVLVLIALPIYWLMPQPNKHPYQPSVDLAQIAYDSGQQAHYPVAAPVQDGWHYNFARWNTGTSDGISFWQTGQVTAAGHYIETTQAQGTNATWVANLINNAPATGKVDISGVSWETHQQTDKETKKITRSYVGQVKGTTIVLSGEADAPEFEALAKATLAYLNQPTYTQAPTATPSNGIQ